MNFEYLNDNGHAILIVSTIVFMSIGALHYDPAGYQQDKYL